jgi:hypothetical protein
MWRPRDLLSAEDLRIVHNICEISSSNIETAAQEGAVGASKEVSPQPHTRGVCAGCKQKRHRHWIEHDDKR